MACSQALYGLRCLSRFKLEARQRLHRTQKGLLPLLPFLYHPLFFTPLQ